ncbi:hypothetical protein ACLB2K_027483 [Fragaria x ananassa]
MNFSHKFIAKLQLIDDLAQPRSPQKENEKVSGSSGLQQVSNVRCCAACVGKKEEHGLMGQSPVSWAFAQLTYLFFSENPLAKTTLPRQENISRSAPGCRAEGLNRTSICLLQLDSLRRVLPRFPNLVTFETSKCITRNDLKFLAQTCPKIETIDLGKYLGKSIDDVTTEPSHSQIEVLYALAHSFPKLSKLSLRRNRDYSGEGITQLIKELVQNKLRHLDLGYCCVLDETLEAIGSLSCLGYLNLDGCDRITDQGLGFLANGSCSKTFKTLVLTGCRGITDSGAVPLHKMAFLEELYLDGETGFSLDGLRAVAMIQTLKKLFVLHVESFEWVV